MSNLMLLFPIFFMIHEFEEIIMVEKWIGKYCTDLYRRFPFLSHRITMLTEIDTRSFSIIVAEEFLIVSVLTIISVMTGNVIFWYCGLSAFSIHLLIHLLQFIIWGKYIPAIVSTIVCAPYCIWSLYETYHILTSVEFIAYSVVGFIFGGINLFCMHKLLRRYGKR